MEKCGESLPSSPLEEACFFVRHSPDLADALGVSSAGSLTVSPLAQGEHNANFLLEDGGGRRFVLRLNYSSQMGLENQIGYEFSALEALAATGRSARARSFWMTVVRLFLGVCWWKALCRGNGWTFLAPTSCMKLHACWQTSTPPVLPPAPAFLRAGSLANPTGSAATVCSPAIARALWQSPALWIRWSVFSRRRKRRWAPVMAPSPLEARHILNTEAVRLIFSSTALVGGRW